VVRPNEPIRSLLNVVVLFTDSVALPARTAGVATVMALPARATGRGPPLSDSVLASATGVLACSTPVDRGIGPLPRALLLPIWSEPDVPCGLDRAPSGARTFTLLVSGPW